MGGYPLFASLRKIIRRCIGRSQGTAAHFQHVINLAAEEARKEKPTVWGGVSISY